MKFLLLLMVIVPIQAFRLPPWLYRTVPQLRRSVLVQIPRNPYGGYSKDLFPIYIQRGQVFDNQVFIFNRPITRRTVIIAATAGVGLATLLYLNAEPKKVS